MHLARTGMECCGMIVSGVRDYTEVMWGEFLMVMSGLRG